MLTESYKNPSLLAREYAAWNYTKWCHVMLFDEKKFSLGGPDG